MSFSVPAGESSTDRAPISPFFRAKPRISYAILVGQIKRPQANRVFLRARGAGLARNYGPNSPCTEKEIYGTWRRFLALMAGAEAVSRQHGDFGDNPGRADLALRWRLLESIHNSR